MANGDKLHPLQQKFLEHAALQCGICTPGVLVAAKSLLERNPNPTEEEVRYWLAGNLCRCTGYNKIIEAVLDAASEMRRSLSMASVIDHPEKELKVVGTQPGAPRRRAEGDGHRPVRRRLHPARHAVGQDPALAARARAHPLHRHVEGGGAAGREGGDDLRRTFPTRSSTTSAPSASP